MAEALGRDKASQIVYRALTEHLESDSGFNDFRTASLQVAGDRYGEDSPEYRAVDEAFHRTLRRLHAKERARLHVLMARAMGAGGSSRARPA